MTPARQDAAGRFENADGRRPRGLMDVLRWQLRLGPQEAPEVFPDAPAPPYRPDLATPDFARIHAPDPARLQATWVGHAT